MVKKNPFAHLGISWQSMKIGVHPYKGTQTGAKSNVCRANRLYKPKVWRSYTEKVGVNDLVYVERVE